MWHTCMNVGNELKMLDMVDVYDIPHKKWNSERQKTKNKYFESIVSRVEMSIH